VPTLVTVQILDEGVDSAKHIIRCSGVNPIPSTEKGQNTYMSVSVSLHQPYTSCAIVHFVEHHLLFLLHSEIVLEHSFRHRGVQLDVVFCRYNSLLDRGGKLRRNAQLLFLGSRELGRVTWHSLVIATRKALPVAELTQAVLHHHLLPSPHTSQANGEDGSQRQVHVRATVETPHFPSQLV